MTIGRHILFWLFITLLQYVIMIAYSSPEHIYSVIEKERTMLESVMGVDGKENIVTRSEAYMKDYFVDSGAVSGSYDLIVPKDVLGDDSSIVSGFKEKLEVFWASLYQTIQRLIIIFFWFKYLLILFIPALITGLVIRKIKIAEYGYTSPVRYHASLHTMIAMLLVPNIYLSLPIAIHPWVVIIWIIAAAYVFSSFVSNIQKKL